MQSSLQKKIHVGVIMDGNGRWAKRRGFPRHIGHLAGVEALKRIVKAAPKMGIGTLTVYAFSADNWKRPTAEIEKLMGLLKHYLTYEVTQLIKNDICLQVIGRRDRLPGDIKTMIAQAEHKTRNGCTLTFRIALDYSARDAILTAVKTIGNIQNMTSEVFSKYLTGATDQQDVDLIIRTSGEQRLSDFLLWESAYAELYFTPCLWPDFNENELSKALYNFRNRNRRFGGLEETAVAV